MHSFDFQQILIIGAGTMGQHIAVEFARFGFSVALYDIDPQQIERSRAQTKNILGNILNAGEIEADQIPAALANIDYLSDPQAAAAGADLLLESVTEDLQVKRRVLREFHRLCPPHTAFATNSSYFVPSSMAKASGRPEHFAAFHFHAMPWFANAVDIMPHPHTSDELVDALCELAPRIGQVPILTRRENWGYLFNAMLQPLLQSAMDLAARDVADYESIDRAWMAVTKMKIGPFGLLDLIGADTVYHVAKQWQGAQSDPAAKRVVEFLQSRIEKSHFGEKSGQGFYSYPNPKFAEPDFLHPQSSQASQSRRTINHNQKWIEKLVPAPLDVRKLTTFEKVSRVALCGQSPTLDSLAESLTALGIEVCRPTTEENKDILSWLRHHSQKKPFSHLWLGHTTQPIAQVAPMAWDQWYRGNVQSPFEIIQYWYGYLANRDDPELATLFFISEDNPRAAYDASGNTNYGLGALVKACWMESIPNPQLQVCAKVIHYDQESPKELRGQQVFEELAAAMQSAVTDDAKAIRQQHADLETFFRKGKRHVSRYQEVARCKTQIRQTQEKEHWLVTGGASGVTLELSLALGKERNASFTILGRTPLVETDYLTLSSEEIKTLKDQVMREAYRQAQKPDVAWRCWEKKINLQRALDRYQQAGLDFEYYQCDVTDPEAMAVVVANLREKKIRVDGVLHGAGVENTCRLEAKTMAGFHETVKPKSLGSLALFHALQDEPVKRWIALGSLTGMLGGVGQADHAMANGLLRNLMREFAACRPGCRFLTIHWLGWKGVGMAARPESRFMLEHSNLRLMSIDEGIRHFLEVLSDEQPTSEIYDQEVLVANFQELGQERFVDNACTQ